VFSSLIIYELLDKSLDNGDNGAVHWCVLACGAHGRARETVCPSSVQPILPYSAVETLEVSSCVDVCRPRCRMSDIVHDIY
jgi:hypothetical protein